MAPVEKGVSDTMARAGGGGVWEQGGEGMGEWRCVCVRGATHLMQHEVDQGKQPPAHDGQFLDLP